MFLDRRLIVEATLDDQKLSPQGSHRVPRSWQEHTTPSHGGFQAGTAALLLVIGAVHLHLWFDGYRNLPTIGPLFVVAVVFLLAVSMSGIHRR